LHPSQTPKSFRGLEHSSGNPTHGHRAVAPAFDVVLHVARSTHETLDRIRRGQRETKSFREAEAEDGQRFIEPFPNALRSTRPLIGETSCEILQESSSCHDVGAVIRAIENRPYPRPLPFRQVIEHVTPFVHLASLNQR